MPEKPLGTRRLQEIYSRTAAFYDEVVAEHQAAAKLMAIELLNRQPGEPFLELAIGTGWAFTRVLQISGTENAYGLDVAPGMVDVARQRLAQDDHHPPPALVLGDSSRQPFRGASFACLLCTYTLECLPGALIDRILAEIRRVLRPEGRLVLTGLTEGEGEDAAMTDEWKEGFARDPEFYGGARPLVLAPFLEANRFQVVRRTYSGHSAGWPSEVVLAKPEG
jgi:ubiquinone/menaquinone biosynthesis C-methylase UbiE